MKVKKKDLTSSSFFCINDIKELKGEVIMKRVLLKKMLGLVGEDINENEYAILIDLIEHIDTIQNYNIRDAAKNNFVSTATISRLCEKFGFGYSEMKYFLKSQYDELKKMDNNHETHSLVYSNVFFNSFKADLNKSVLLWDEKLIKAVVEQLKNADKIIVLGLGMSEIFGNYFTQRFQIMGKDVQFLSIGLSGGVFYNGIKNADLILVFSRSGELRYLKNKLEIASNSNKKIISITNDKESELKKVSDYTLPIFGTKALNTTEGMSTYNLMVFYLIDLLIILYGDE